MKSKLANSKRRKVPKEKPVKKSTITSKTVEADAGTEESLQEREP